MRKEILFAILLIAFISGCVQGVTYPGDIAKNSADVKAFLNEYPHATVIATLFSNISINEECNNPQLPITDYWKVTVKDPDTNMTLIAYIDTTSKKTVCAVKTGGAVPSQTEPNSTTSTLKPEEVAVKAVKFINDNLVQPNTTASYFSTVEFEGLYNVTVSYQGKYVSVFLTKDGTNMFLSSPTNIGTSTFNVLKPEEASLKAVKFINENLVAANTTASFVSVSDFQGIYNISVDYQGRNVSVYITKDGSYMFLSSPLDITQSLPQATQQQQPIQTPKTAKPTVQLYVMAFCPYGIQAEQAMKPVVDLLGGQADIQVHFIASVGGTTPDSVQSLHGPVEAQEDLRQVCIMKYYDQKTYWNYMMAIDATCSGQRSDSTAYDACWKSAAQNASIDVTKIDTCSKGEGVTLLKADADLSSANGVSGSPTLIINGVTYNGARTPDAYKAAICNAFTTAPLECSQNLTATAAAASGNCAT